MMSAKRNTAEEQVEGLISCGSGCCRTCLVTEDLVSIFYNCDEQIMSHNLQLVTGVEIKRNDGLPQEICNKCLTVFKLTMQFRHKSKKAEKALLEMLNNTINKNVTVEFKNIVKKEVKQENNSYFEVPLTDDIDNADKMLIGESNDVDVKPINVVQEMKPRALKPIRKRRRMEIPSGPPYKCHICTKEILIKAVYSRHMRFHLRSHACESCGKKFQGNKKLEEHKRMKHGLARIYKCGFCEYSPATKEALTAHERRHTGERPYICDQCGAAFCHRGNLVQHLPVHLPDNNFQCDMCPKKLKSRKFLQIHKHNAHTGKRYGYLCSVCSHRFKRPYKVREHLKRVHGVPDEQQGPIERVQLAS